LKVSYLSGLFDGEGCIGLNIVGYRETSWNIKPHLTINLKTSKEASET
jgi:hypothetical protein